MSQQSGVQIGSTVISGTQTVILRFEDYVIGHPIPGREGWIAEREGSKVARIELHGFSESGDSLKDQLSGMIGRGVSLAVPSPMQPNWFALIPSTFVIESLQFIPLRGRAYPYTEWVIKGTVESGIALSWPGGVVGVMSGLSTGGIVMNFSGIPASLADYSQVLPVGISLHPDYSQVLPVSITKHPDYIQVLPIFVGLNANYVRVS